LQARIGEDHGLQVVFQKLLGDAGRFVDIAAADAEGAIHYRRIVEDESFFSGRSAVGGLDFDLGFEEARGEFAGIGDGCGAADKLWISAVETGDAAEAAEDIAEMAAENAAVGVEFIEDDVAEIFEEARPARMVREDAGVKHVGIGENDVTLFADGFAGVARSVAVVSENTEAIIEALIKVVEFGELVLREGFGGEEVKRAAIGIFEDSVQDGQVVAKSFSGSCGRDNDDVFSGVDRFGGGGLMGVEAANALCGVGGGEIRVNPGGEVSPLGIAGGEVADGGEDFGVVVAGGEGVEDFVDAGDGGWDGGVTNG